MNKNALIAIAVVVAGLALWLLYGVLSAPGPTAVKVPVPVKTEKQTSLLRFPNSPKPQPVAQRPSSRKPSSASVQTAVNVVSENLKVGVSVGGKK